MQLEIQFIEGKKEISSPIIKLTRSINGKTGTATFLFIHPRVFKEFSLESELIKGMYLVWENKTIFTTDITILFKEGKPFLLKSILIFKNSTEWFDFLNFMNLYSKEKGLLYDSQSISF